MTSSRSINALFIVSTGRTGTQFLARFFQQFGATSRHEPGPFWLREASNAYVSGHLSPVRASSLLVDARTDDLGMHDLYVESSCLVYGLAGPLLDTFATAAVVHVVRDPKTYVRSGVNWGAYRFAGRVRNIVPFRRLAKPQFAPLSLGDRLRWMSMGQFERLCWSWAAMNGHMREAVTGHPRGLTVRFEDIFDAESGYPGLHAIAELIGLSPTAEDLEAFASRPINAAKRGTFPKWEDWSRAQRATLRELCATEAAFYGYDLSDPPAGQ